MRRLPCIALWLALSVAASAAGTETDEQAIRACFTDYWAAIAKKDGNAAAALISKASLSDYGSILNLALNSEGVRVRVRLATTGFQPRQPPNPDRLALDC